MPECPTGNYPNRLCALEEQMAEVLASLGHPAAHLTFSSDPNSWDDETQVGNINVPAIPAIPAPEVVVAADAAARAAAVPQKLNQLLVQTTDATNGNFSVWAATGLSAGNWTLKTGTMSSQNANAVSITGGSISGITDLAVADGGTGASTPAGARVSLLTPTTAPTAFNIDWNLSNNFSESIIANTAFTFTNPANGMSMTLVTVNSGAYTVDFPAGVQWGGGTAPTATSGGTDVWTFVCIGGVVYGSVIQDFS
jgi:hypothetical protein